MEKTPPKVFDTTLRDGEQMPQLAFSSDDKLAIAKKLDELGVHVIEAGFPVNSKEELEAIKRVTDNVSATVCSIGRVIRKDLEAIIASGSQMADVICSTSDIQMELSQRMTRDQCMAASLDAVSFIKDAGISCMFTPMDASRTDPAFLRDICAASIEKGADWIGLTDTVGICTPESTAQLVKSVADLGVPVSIHCHNDFGLGTANTISGVLAGAGMFQACVNGLGERAGNASLEEILMALKSLYGIDCGIRTEGLYSLSRLVERLSCMGVAPNKPVVGANAFAHESGIHAAGVVKNHQTFEPGIMTPEMVGQRRRMVLGKHTGKHGIARALSLAGLEPKPEELTEIVQRVRSFLDKGKQVMSADLYAVAETVMQKVPADLRTIKLEQLVVTTGDKISPTASLAAKVRGQDRVEAETGVGPVDAAFKAVKNMVADEIKLEIAKFHVDAITGGSTATVRVEVTVEDETGRQSSAHAAHTDIVVASVDALLTATNHLIRLRNNGHSNEKDT